MLAVVNSLAWTTRWEIYVVWVDPDFEDHGKFQLRVENCSVPVIFHTTTAQVITAIAVLLLYCTQMSWSEYYLRGKVPAGQVVGGS